MFIQKGWTGLMGHIAEFSVTKVFVKDGLLLIVNISVERVDLGEHVAVDLAKVLPAIQIEIEEARAPAYVACILSKPGCEGHFVEVTVSPILVESREFIGEICAKDAEMVIPAIVSSVYSHAGHCPAIPVVCNTSKHTFLFETPMALVHVEQ